MNYDIALAEPVDAQRIASMSGQLIEHGLPPSWDVPRVVRHMRHRDSVVIKAVGREGEHDPEALLGFAIMSFQQDAAHLSLLAVEPDYRRLKIGRGLLAWLEETAVTAGTFFISLEVRAGNRAAQRFYRALGYDETDRVVDYYSGIEDAVLFARDLRVYTLAKSN